MESFKVFASAFSSKTAEECFRLLQSESVTLFNYIRFDASGDNLYDRGGNN